MVMHIMNYDLSSIVLIGMLFIFWRWIIYMYSGTGNSADLAVFNC